MGCYLGLWLVNFYMGYIENKIIIKQQCNIPPYVKYVDNTFVIYNNNRRPENEFEAESVLKFTIKHSTNGKLSFLDDKIKKI